MKITFDDMVEEPTELLAERRQAFFADDPELRELQAARVDLAMPRTEALTVDRLGGHRELQQYVAEQPDQSFHIVRLGCSFKLDAAEPFLRASLAVDLGPVAPDGAAPIAWSMAPLRESTSRKVSTELSLGPKLKLGPAELGSQIKRGEEVVREDPFLEALAEGTSRPAWEFSRTKHRDLSGSFRLAMVVQSPRHAGGRGLVSLKAVVVRKKLGPINYRALFRQRPSLEFFIPAP